MLVNLCIGRIFSLFCCLFTAGEKAAPFHLLLCVHSAMHKIALYCTASIHTRLSVLSFLYSRSYEVADAYVRPENSLFTPHEIPTSSIASQCVNQLASNRLSLRRIFVPITLYSEYSHEIHHRSGISCCYLCSCCSRILCWTCIGVRFFF